MKRDIITPSAFWIALTILFLNFCSPLAAEYERVLVDYAIEEFNETKKVHFFLDNGWVFVGAVDPLDEFKLYNLENLLHTRLRIEANIGEPGFRIILENPQKQKYDKINFPVFPTPETIETLPIVESLSEYSYLFGLMSSPVISLSDGSSWVVRVYNDRAKVTDFWNEGNRVFVSRQYNNENYFMLANVDVVGQQRVCHSYESGHCYYSIQDPRNVRVSSVE